MKSYRTSVFALLGALGVSLCFALAVLSAHSPLTGTTNETVGFVHESNRPLTEMHKHAKRQFGHYTAQPHTYASADQWSADWDLHWIDVEHDGHLVRIFHATDRRHPDRKFVATWDARNAQPSAWEQLR